MRVRVTTPILGAISKQSHIASGTCARAWQAASLGCAAFTGNFTPLEVLPGSPPWPYGGLLGKKKKNSVSFEIHSRTNSIVPLQKFGVRPKASLIAATATCRLGLHRADQECSISYIRLNAR